MAATAEPTAILWPRSSRPSWSWIWWRTLRPRKTWTTSHWMTKKTRRRFTREGTHGILSRYRGPQGNRDRPRMGHGRRHHHQPDPDREDGPALPPDRPGNCAAGARPRVGRG